MKSRLPQCHKAVRDLQPSSITSLWITDRILSQTFDRFVRRFDRSLSKRFGSHVPGPLEARRRLAKRRIAGLASNHVPEAPVRQSVFDILFGPPRKQPLMRWEPPRATQSVAMPPTAIVGSMRAQETNFSPWEPPWSNLSQSQDQLPSDVLHTASPTAENADTVRWYDTEGALPYSFPGLAVVPQLGYIPPEDAQHEASDAYEVERQHRKLQPQDIVAARKQLSAKLTLQLESMMESDSADFAELTSLYEPLLLDTLDESLDECMRHQVELESACFKSGALKGIIHQLNSVDSNSRRVLNLRTFLNWVWQHFWHHRFPNADRQVQSEIWASATVLIEHAMREIRYRHSRSEDISDILDLQSIPLELLSDLSVRDLLVLVEGNMSHPDAMSRIQEYFHIEAETESSTDHPFVSKFADEVELRAQQYYVTRDTKALGDLTNFLRMFDLAYGSNFINRVAAQLVSLGRAGSRYQLLGPLHLWLRCLRMASLDRDCGDTVSWSGSRLWMEVYDTLACKVDPSSIATHLVKMESANMGRVILRHWVPANVELSTQAQREVLETFDALIAKRKPKAGHGPNKVCFALVEALTKQDIDTETTLIQIISLLDRLRPTEFGRGKIATFVYNQHREDMLVVSKRAAAEAIYIVSKSFPRRARTLALRYPQSSLSLYPAMVVILAGLGHNNAHRVKQILLDRPDPLAEVPGMPYPWREPHTGRMVEAGCTLHPLRIDLVHMVASAFARNTAINEPTALLYVWQLHTHLKRHDAPLGPAMAQALVHAGIVRYLERKRYLSWVQYRDIVEVVREVKGDEEADQLAEITQRVRKEMGWDKGRPANMPIERPRKRKLRWEPDSTERPASWVGIGVER